MSPDDRNHLWSQRANAIRRLRLTEEEIAFFVLKVRVSSKSRPGAAAAPRGRVLVALKAAAASLRAQKSCAPLVDGIAFMDHSDDGIRKLVERAGITWVEPKKHRLSTIERLLSATIACAFVLANWDRVQRAISAETEAIDLSLARNRLLAGSGCFARFLSQALLGRNAWNGLFVSGDISFLRMFACFAASRTRRPISVYRRHRVSEDVVMPIPVNRLFTMDPSTSRNFNPIPANVIVEPRPVRRQKRYDVEALDVGIVTDNFVSVKHVWEIARECAIEENVRVVRVRLHPGSPVRELPLGLAPAVNLEDSREELSAYAERIDLALVSMSSAVPLLQELLVPCYHLRLFYATDDPWGRNFPETELSSRYPVPEVVTHLRAFLNALTANQLNLEIESLRDRLMKEPAEGTTALLRSELESLLGR